MLTATADVSCRLLEVDFGSIEALITGRMLWAHGLDDLGAAQYIRLARLGMHAAVTSLKVGKPVDLTQDDKTVKKALGAIKKEFAKEYDTAKRTVHANNYGMTVYGMVEKFPEFFPTIKAAQEFQQYYYDLAPALPKWHLALRKRARDTGKLGGRTMHGPASMWDHPYGYQHWFHDVLDYRVMSDAQARKWLNDPERKQRVVPMHGRYYQTKFGGDANRVIAFYPQSIGAGRLKEAEAYAPHGLFWPDSPYYIGDCYFGRTPLLGPIHDSLLLHIPNRCWDKVVEKVAMVMQAPSPYLPIPAHWGLGDYMQIGIAAKAGKNWAEHIDVDKQIKLKIEYNVDVALNESGMEDIDVPSWVPTAGQDLPVLPMDMLEEENDVEDWQMFQRAVA